MASFEQRRKRRPNDVFRRERKAGTACARPGKHNFHFRIVGARDLRRAAILGDKGGDNGVA